MNRILCSILILCYCLLSASGQKVLSSKDMVAITPAVASSLDLPEYAKKALYQKLIQIVTQNGFGSTSGDLILTANVLVTDKQMTGTVPAQFIVNLEVSLYLLNIEEEVVLDETSIALKGIDKIENRAMAQAINNLNPRSPAVRNFMNQCRTKVIDYYTTRIPALLAKAKSLADRANYEEALAVLAVVPESVDEYPAIAEQMVNIYLKKVDKDAAALLQEAKAQMAVKDYTRALNALLAIDPSSGRFAEAGKMIDKIKQTIDAEEKAAMEAQLAQYEAEKEAQQRAHDDAVMLEKLRIEAAKKAGAAYSNSSASSTSSGVNEALNNRLAKWLLGKFN